MKWGVREVVIKVEKRIYDPPEDSDGRRILVMTLWPRGVSKQKVDVWMKELGTPKETMKGWKAGEITWNQFAKEYNASLKGKELLLRELSDQSKRGTVTLLCVERDYTRCHRSLLKAAIERI